MGRFPGTSACLAWTLRKPLTSQWEWTKPDQRDRVLAFWIRASKSDEWTFKQLQELLDTLIDSDEIPGALQAWASDVAAGRQKIPTRTGPKSDPKGDFITMADAVFRNELQGISFRRAYREISKEQSETNRCPKGVESAVRRGRKWPPGAF